MRAPADSGCSTPTPADSGCSTRHFFIPARVAREDRESYIVYAAGRALRAQVAGALRHRAVSRIDFPAVGDWVAVAPPVRGTASGGGGPAIIHGILPRSSMLMRRGAGNTGEQLLAANVDTLLICCGLDHDFNLRRIERYLTFAYSGGVSPVVLLTKADLCESVENQVAEVEAIAGGAPVVALSNIDHRGVAEVAAFLPRGSTATLVGSSGVGKSSLINAILARDEMKIGAVRGHDSRGRHTTTHRQMLLIPGGGVIIDTPGMRELALLADADDVSASFDDIESLSASCRFRDCTHSSEPGCAVLNAVESGDMDPGRLESYRKQLRELAYFDRKGDPFAEAAERKRWKTIHKAAQQWMREKYRM